MESTGWSVSEVSFLRVFLEKHRQHQKKRKSNKSLMILDLINKVKVVLMFLRKIESID